MARQHYVANGFREGRSTTAFNAAQYLANYADLQAAFGSDLAAATRHYIANGHAEGRTDLPPSAPADPGAEYIAGKTGDPGPEVLHIFNDGDLIAFERFASVGPDGRFVRVEPRVAMMSGPDADEGLIAGYAADELRTLPLGNFELETLADTPDSPSDLQIGNR